MLRKCCRVVTFAYMHVTGTENHITCTPAIQWVMTVYVNGLLIYNVPHMLSLSVCNLRFSVDRKWLRTAAQLLGCKTWHHSSEMWITCTVAIRLGVWRPCKWFTLHCYVVMSWILTTVRQFLTTFGPQWNVSYTLIKTACVVHHRSAVRSRILLSVTEWQACKLCDF